MSSFPFVLLCSACQQMMNLAELEAHKIVPSHIQNLEKFVKEEQEADSQGNSQDDESEQGQPEKAPKPRKAKAPKAPAAPRKPRAKPVKPRAKKEVTL